MTVIQLASFVIPDFKFNLKLNVPSNQRDKPSLTKVNSSPKWLFSAVHCDFGVCEVLRLICLDNWFLWLRVAD